MNLDSNTRLSDLVLKELSLVPLLASLGMEPGYGAERIGEACNRAGLPVGFFIRAIGLYLRPGDVADCTEPSAPNPDSDSHSDFDARGLAEFIRATDSWFLNVQLPNIRRHFAMLMQRGEGDAKQGLALLMGFYTQLEGKFRQLDAFDRESLASLLLSPGPSSTSDSAEPSLSDHRQVSLKAALPERARELTESLSEELSDLLRFFVEHLPKGSDPNLYFAVVSSISALESHLHKTSAVRDAMLRELCTGGESQACNPPE